MKVSFLSWNLGLLERSAQAPYAWQPEHTEAAVRERVLATAPDVVAFQELPRLVPYVETHAMVPANPVSHSGNMALLVKHDLFTSLTSHGVVDGCALLATFGDLTIANVHLAPGSGAVAERLEQVARIVESSPTPNLLIIGDTNTRRPEEAALADAGIFSTPPPKATWNSRRNRFRRDAPEFTAYFTRWFASGDVKVREVKVWNEPIEFDDHTFHVSDHYALSGVALLE